MGPMLPPAANRPRFPEPSAFLVPYPHGVARCLVKSAGEGHPTFTWIASGLRQTREQAGDSTSSEMTTVRRCEFRVVSNVKRIPLGRQRTSFQRYLPRLVRVAGDPAEAISMNGDKRLPVTDRGAPQMSVGWSEQTV